MQLKKLALIGAATSILAIACGGDKGSSDGGDGDGDSGDGDGDSQQMEADGDGSGGGMGDGGAPNPNPNPEPEPEPEPTGPVLNTPGAEVTTELFDTDSTGLFLVSSNLLTSPSGGDWFEQWYAVIGNDGPNTLCYVQAEVDFLSAGAIVAEHYGYADAAPFMDPTDSFESTIPCIAPGEVGVVYSNAFVSSNFGANTVDAIEIILVGSDYGVLVPHPMTPTYTPSATQDWTVAGTATAVDDIYNIGIDVYAYGPDGLVYDRQTAFHLDPFYKGSTWEFETYSFDEEVVDFEDFIDFLPGDGSFKVVGEGRSNDSNRDAKKRLEAVFAKNSRRAGE